jgi:hypothetical protein
VLFIGVCALGDGGVDPLFESHHVFVAGGQDSGGDEDAAQVLDCLPGGQFVECLVGDGASGELTQHLGRGASVEPSAQRGWPLGRGQRPVEDLPVGRDGAGVVGEQLVQAFRDGAASAPPVVEPSGLAAAGATAPGVVGPGAQRAQRLVDCSAAQRSDLAATSAADPPLLAREAPGCVGGLGDHARCGPPADRARQHGARYALATQRSVGCSNLDRSTSTALDACFAVGGIGDQAVGAQRSPLLVAGRGFADRPAPGAGLGAGFGGAVAAQPLPVDSPVQVNDSTAAGAGRAHYRACSGVAQGVDKAQDRPDRCFGAGTGEQLGPVLQRPGKLMTVPGPGGRQPHRCGGDVARQGRVGGGYHVDREFERVTPTVGRTRHAAWFSVAVPGVDRADSSALAAWFADRTADCAVPVVAAALQCAQVFAALGAHWCRNLHCASFVQRDKQVPDRARGWGTPVGEHTRPVQ